MKYQFKIRFNTEHSSTPDLCWRALINGEEHLVADVNIENLPVSTVSHVLETGERKWSISCESDHYRIDERNILFIEP
jgi:hypothetical protein